MPFQICRVCYERGYDLFNLKDDVHNYEQKLSSCIPEIDIYVIHNPGICRTCADILDVAYSFRNKCLENEKRYNSTFTERNKESTMQISIKSESGTKEDRRTNVHEFNESYDSPDLLSVLRVKTISKVSCSVCNKEFSSEHDKKLHSSVLHRQLRYRNLKESMFLRKQSIIDEAVESYINNKYLQVLCDAGNTSVQNDNKSSGDTELICDECNTTFTTSHELELHKLVHFKKSCHICAKTFHKESELTSHVKLHFIKCCGESFATASLLQLHTYKEHNLTCGICNENFTQISALFVHVLDHVEIHWYKCNFCGKQFKTSEELHEHNCQYYVCHICSTIYFTTKTYRKHLEIHQPNVEFADSIEIQNVPCKSCNKHYQTQALLLEHMVREHGAREDDQSNSNPLALREDSFTCGLCENVYRLHIHLKTHILQAHCNRILTIPVIDYRKCDYQMSAECLRKNLNVLSKYLTQSMEINSLGRRPYLRKRFQLLSEYITHEARAQISSNDLIARCVKICFACNVLYTSYKSFCTHIKVIHSSCCKVKFKSVNDYFQHNFTHYDEADKVDGGKKILCLRCKSKHKNYTALLIHSCNEYNNKRTDHINLLKRTNKVKLKRVNHVSAKNELKTAENIETDAQTNTQCTIEIPEIDPSDQPDYVSYENDHNYNAKRLLCEMCREHFESKPALVEHIKIHF